MCCKFVLVILLLLAYNIVIDLYLLNMFCDIYNDVINYNGKHNTDIINYYNGYHNESFILKGDIEEGLGEYDAYNNQIQKPNICKNNYFKLISNISYKIIKNMKQIVSKQVNYFYSSKKKMENYL
jgi:hypothetical protein